MNEQAKRYLEGLQMAQGGAAPQSEKRDVAAEAFDLGKKVGKVAIGIWATWTVIVLIIAAFVGSWIMRGAGQIEQRNAAMFQAADQQERAYQALPNVTATDMGVKSAVPVPAPAPVAVPQSAQSKPTFYDGRLHTL